MITQRYKSAYSLQKDSFLVILAFFQLIFCVCSWHGVEYLSRVGGLGLRDVRVVDVEHVVADHLLPHAARPFCHLQRELVQVGADGRPPEAALAQQLILDGRPLLRHVLQGVLLSLPETRDGWKFSNIIQVSFPTLQIKIQTKIHCYTLFIAVNDDLWLYY